MNKKEIIISLCVIIILIFCTIFALINSFSDKFVYGVNIEKINCHQYTENEVKEIFSKKIENVKNKKITFKLGENTSETIVDELNVQYEYNDAITKAFLVGREKNIFLDNFQILSTMIFKRNFNINIDLDEEKLNEKIHSLYNIVENIVTEPNYYIENNKLIIIKGKKGTAINEEALKEQILEQIYNLNEENCTIEIPTYEKEPEEIDIEKIYNEIHKEAQNATITEDGIVQPNVDGIDFEMPIDEIKKLLSEEKDEYEIPLKITKADITVKDLGKDAFPESLGKFETRYNILNENRANNIKLSSEKINGIIIMPGETFSYNQIVGKRTIDAGYAEAGAYAGGKVVQEVGGGICQVSSTLYNAVLYANLEVTERSNHYFECSYVSPGRDATVSWGGVDFKFKNTRKYPILIEMTAENGVCRADIKGIKEKDEFEVIIQTKTQSVINKSIKYENDDSIDTGKEKVKQEGSDGVIVDTYKILKQNGENVSSEKISTDYYHALEKIIIRGTKQGAPAEDEEENIKEGLKKELL